MIAAMAAAAVPLILASLGGLLSERAGVLNISLEGCMTAGAFTAAILVNAGVPVGAALPAALLAGAILGGILAAVHLGLGANLFIAGLGINLLVPSLTGMISRLIHGHKGNITLPGRIFESFTESGVLPASAAALLLIPATALILHRSAFGRAVRAAGSDSGFLAERGLETTTIRLLTLMISSAAAALAGAYITLRIGAWVPGMVAGRGWISLVIIWLGFKRPAGILMASYFFSITEIISGRLQGDAGLSSTLFLALPYLMALLALILATLGHRGRNKRE
jgi:simple sugar transport system permease protein